MEIIHHHQKEKKDVEIRPGRLADFLGIDPRIGEYAETMEYLEGELTRNFETKLFRETFLLIERAILQRKLAAIYTSNQVLLINCVECSQDMATVWCADWGDHFCAHCFDDIRSQKAYATLEKYDINTNPLGTIPGGQKQSITVTSGPGQKKTETIWRKFEYFNFPISEDHDQFKQIQLHFERMKRAYVDMNYIDQITGEIDVGAAVTDQNYDSLTKDVGR